MITISHLDHLVLTVADLDATVEFYRDVLGMAPETFASGGVQRRALKFGDQKFNLHQAGREFEPKAAKPQPGSIDVCLICDTAPDQLIAHLEKCNITIEQGPVQRTGALGKIVSVYIRDPDGNLIEISSYPSP